MQTKKVFIAKTILPVRRPRRRGRLVASLLVAVTVGSAIWWIAPLVGWAQDSTAVGVHKVAEASFRPDRGELLFIAAIGTDVRSGEPDRGGGCDAIHIVAINPQSKAGTILNFPRDSYIGGTKLTDICRRRGVSSLVSTLRSHTGIDIQYYVTTEFSNFREFVNDLGGMDVDVPYAMNDAPSGARFNAGPQHLSGSGVLALSRNRKDTPRGDFSRTDNQGIVILAGLAKFRQEVNEDPHRLLDYIRVARKHVKITVPPDELLQLAFIAREIDPAALQNVTISGSTGSAGSASVVFLAPGDTYNRVKDDAVF